MQAKLRLTSEESLLIQEIIKKTLLVLSSVLSEHQQASVVFCYNGLKQVGIWANYSSCQDYPRPGSIHLYRGDYPEGISPENWARLLALNVANLLRCDSRIGMVGEQRLTQQYLINVYR